MLRELRCNLPAISACAPATAATVVPGSWQAATGRVPIVLPITIGILALMQIGVHFSRGSTGSRFAAAADHSSQPPLKPNSLSRSVKIGELRFSFQIRPERAFSIIITTRP